MDIQEALHAKVPIGTPRRIYIEGLRGSGSQLRLYFASLMVYKFYIYSIYSTPMGLLNFLCQQSGPRVHNLNIFSLR